MKLLTIEEAGKVDIKWRAAIDKDIPFGNLEKAKLLHVVVEAHNGFKWDQIIFVEPIGAVTVPMDFTGRFGLVTPERPLLSLKLEGGNIKSRDAAGIRAFIKHQQRFFEDPRGQRGLVGRPSWEFPRGFPLKGENPWDTASRETAEETGSPMKSVKLIGYGHTNTTYYPQAQPYFLGTYDPAAAKNKENVPPDVNEKIWDVQWFTADQVNEKIADGDITCQMSLAAWSIVQANLRR